MPARLDSVRRQPQWPERFCESFRLCWCAAASTITLVTQRNCWFLHDCTFSLKLFFSLLFFLDPCVWILLENPSYWFWKMSSFASHGQKSCCFCCPLIPFSPFRVDQSVVLPFTKHHQCCELRLGCCVGLWIALFTMWGWCGSCSGVEESLFLYLPLLPWCTATLKLRRFLVLKMSFSFGH